MEVIFMDGKVIQEKQDFRWLRWSRIHNSPGTQGTFMKSVSDLDIKKYINSMIAGASD